jgi:hypothetical protein
MWKRPHGRTPLQLYNYCLFDDPPVSDLLTKHIMTCLRRMDERRARLIGSNTDIELERKAIEIDGDYLEFLRGKLPNGRQIADVLAEVVPSKPEQQEITERHPGRELLYGRICEYLEFEMSASFFETAGGYNSFIDVAPRVTDTKAGMILLERKDLIERLEAGGAPTYQGSKAWQPLQMD